MATAWNDLSTERHAPNAPIPYSSINAYADELGLTYDVKDHFATVIRLVDDAHLERLAAEARAAQKGKGKGKAGAGARSMRGASAGDAKARQAAARGKGVVRG